jgi:hypothetical protein
MSILFLLKVTKNDFFFRNFLIDAATRFLIFNFLIIIIILLLLLLLLVLGLLLMQKD